MNFDGRVSVITAAMSDPVCCMFREEYGCKGTSEVLLAVYPDGTVELFCRDCVAANATALAKVRLFSIGSEVK